MTPGLEFQTGLDLNYPDLPIMLNFARGGQIVVSTRWSVVQARGIVAGLQKYIEMHARDSAALAKTIHGADPEALLRAVNAAGEAAS